MRPLVARIAPWLLMLALVTVAAVALRWIAPGFGVDIYVHDTYIRLTP